MLKFTDYDIVFQEIPDETTLAINLSLCPNRCKGCHSPQLWSDIGEELTEQQLDKLLQRYGSAITCVSLMGGDNDPAAVNHFAQLIRAKGKRSAWYSGKKELAEEIDIENFNYIKLGPYIAQFGGLKEPTTNQRLYRVTATRDLEDITARLQKK